ncbi:MAG: SoxR reducing system RseC family protein [Candidatus Saganbacteria bacterium]|nr:SoxR reducing system RseC family protein [Candidatus Saganbacteria bacterium]
MREEGAVKRIVSQNIAEVELLGGGCKNCSCACQGKSGPKILQAINEINAKVGDKVEVEISSPKLLGAFLLVYILPILFLFLGYWIVSLVTADEGLKIFGGFLGLALGLLLVKFLVSRNKNFSARIVAC